jgi:sulfur-carrier protein adenylyltransferase/sulfurtransferase
VSVPAHHDRQARLAGIGEAGQAKLSKARVLIVGVGGLGCPAALYLAGAGVGHLTLVDSDEVDASNLHRQILYASADVGRQKVHVAQKRLLALDASLNIDARFDLVTAANAQAMVANHDVVLDCTDDLEAKLAIARACAKAKIPLVHGAAVAWDGLVGVFDPPQTPCYFCAFPQATAGPTCSQEGVLGPLVGQLGALQAQEAIKLLVGQPSHLRGALHLVDGRTGMARTITLKKRTGCECSMNTDAAEGPACPMPWNAPTVREISVAEFEQKKAQVFLLDVREPYEHEEISIPASTLIPLGSLPRRLNEIPRNKPVVVYCAVGGRSARATEFLREQGVEAVNLRGGIRSWLMHHG